MFLIKLCFYKLYELFLDPQSQPSYIRSTLTQFIYFFARKKH
jgi:hypothetical protein